MLVTFPDNLLYSLDRSTKEQFKTVIERLKEANFLSVANPMISQPPNNVNDGWLILRFEKFTATWYVGIQIVLPRSINEGLRIYVRYIKSEPSREGNSDLNEREHNLILISLRNAFQQILNGI